MTDDEIKIRLDQVELKQVQAGAEIWTQLVELRAELDIQGDVIHALAANVPNLDRVMEVLLSRKDEILERSSSAQSKQLSAKLLDRWHMRLLHAQRVLGQGGPRA